MRARRSGGLVCAFHCEPNQSYAKHEILQAFTQGQRCRRIEISWTTVRNDVFMIFSRCYTLHGSLRPENLIKITVDSSFCNCPIAARQSKLNYTYNQITYRWVGPENGNISCRTCWKRIKLSDAVYLDRNMWLWTLVFNAANNALHRRLKKACYSFPDALM